MKLCSQSEGILLSRMSAAARSRIMEAPVSLAAHIIFTTMPVKLFHWGVFIVNNDHREVSSLQCLEIVEIHDSNMI